MSRTLEEGVDIPVFPLCTQTETVHDFRQVGITDRHLILCIDDAVAIDILIFDISYTVFTESLTRAVVNFFLTLE
ncbi:hypothetical protein CK234_04101 [Phocaeicola vulgatus]|nr:hypothetical protein CK234_04101 [Phocaeicola vulgatus]